MTHRLVVRATAVLALLLGAGPTAAGPGEPLEFGLGSRWSLTVHGLQATEFDRRTTTASFAAGGFASSETRPFVTPQPSPTSQLTVSFRGGAASLTRGPDATSHLRPWVQQWQALSGDWYLDPESVDDPRLARRRLRQAIAHLLRSAGGADMPSTLELGTSTTRYPYTRLAPFPEGSGFSRMFGLNQVSMRLASNGDGHLVLGRRIGPDAFLALEPGLGGTRHQARLQYRFAPWLELRMQAGHTRAIELVTVIPLQ